MMFAALLPMMLSSPEPPVTFSTSSASVVALGRLDVVGDPYWRRAACAGSGGAYVAPTYLRTINGVGPDVHGNFSLTPLAWLTADPVLRVRAEAGGLVLSSFGKGA